MKYSRIRLYRHIKHCSLAAQLAYNPRAVLRICRAQVSGGEDLFLVGPTMTFSLRKGSVVHLQARGPTN